MLITESGWVTAESIELWLYVRMSNNRQTSPNRPSEPQLLCAPRPMTQPLANHWRGPLFPTASTELQLSSRLAPAGTRPQEPFVNHWAEARFGETVGTSAPSSARTSHSQWLFCATKILGASLCKKTLPQMGSWPNKSRIVGEGVKWLPLAG